MKRKQPSKRQDIAKTEDAEAALGPPPHIIAMLHSPRLPEAIRRKCDAVRERCVEQRLQKPSSIEFVTLWSGERVTRKEYLLRTLPSVLLTEKWWLEDDQDPGK